MPAIDAENLRKVMERAPITTKQLADAIEMSLTYTSDIVLGRRTLKRNPVLRARIARACNVPTFWIEVQDSSKEAVA